jgi:hypothetical protein
MAEEDIDASQQQFCDVAEEMTKSIASTRELIQALREKYERHALAVRSEHLQPIGTDKKRHLILNSRMAYLSSP